MISVKDILQLPALKSLEVIAGKNALENKVGYVTVMEVPDITRWLAGNDFLITSFYSVRKDVSKQCELIEELSKSSCSCIAVKTGKYVKEIAKEVIDTADRCNMPILQIPYTMRYIHIIINIMSAILEERNMDQIIEKYIKDIIFDAYEDENLMIERGKLLGIMVEDNYYYAITLGFPKHYEPSSKEIEDMNRICKSLGQFLSNSSNITFPAVINMKGQCSVILEGKTKEMLHQYEAIIIHELQNQMNYYFPKVKMKAGMGTIDTNLNGVKNTFLYSVKAYRAGEMFRSSEQIHRFEDVEIYCMMERLITAETKEFSEHIINKISNKEILQTLRVYLECNGDYTEIAERMHIHKNTIKYRMAKVQEITGLDLKNYVDNFKLYLAVLIDKMSNKPNL